jgi:hypothetical protein
VIVERRDTQRSRDFWDHVRTCAREVATWPKWMGGEGKEETVVSSYAKLGETDMLRATVEIIRASDHPPIPIGVLEADNVGGDEHYGNYALRLYQHSNSGTTCQEGFLHQFRRAQGAVELVRAALASLSRSR